MREITAQNDLKDKNDNIPQILNSVKNKIETPEFKQNIVKILLIVEKLEGNALNIQNAGKKITKKRFYNKTLKRKNKSGGQRNMKLISVNFIIF